MLRRILFFAALSTMTLGSQAKVRLPHIISDNMILQQDSKARLWGWDTPGKAVKVNVSWSKETFSAKTDNNGKWILEVQTPKASYTPLSITFNDGDKTTISNVLSGEVWVCAGQSNMEMPVKGFGNCPVEGYNKAVMNANEYKGIHYVKIPSVMSTKPLDDSQCEWKVISPETVGDASATGYFFAQAINKTLNIPVGLVMANKGGTRVESWLDRDYLEKNTTESLDSMAMIKKFPYDYLRPLLWGNGTFSPILKYTVKGIIFYQGCSNVGDPAGQYTKRLNDLVSQWRRDFKLGEIPFYFVQIAPYFNSDVNGDWGPKLREQQFNASKIIPNSGIV
jgi:sialate O-acetylesterase